MMTIEEYARKATSANEPPDDSTRIGRYYHESLGWMTLWINHEGEVRYVTDHMAAFNRQMKEAQKRNKKEKRRFW